MREAFKGQAELFRRNGDAARAAFWEARSNRIADAAGRSARQAGQLGFLDLTEAFPLGTDWDMQTGHSVNITMRIIRYGTRGGPDDGSCKRQQWRSAQGRRFRYLDKGPEG